MLESIDILGVKISVVDIPKARAYIEDCITHKRKTYICIAPVSTIVDCQRDLEYRKIINAAGMTTPDGVPLVWLGKLKGKKTIERTYGPDLMWHLCTTRSYRHYFYGATSEVLSCLQSRLKNQFPLIKIVGSFSPPFSRECQDESPALLDEINRLKPDILWVGLGSPKQDFWMSRHRSRLEVPVMIGVGAAFDFLAGTKKQAPVWMRRCGLEWFFRLCSEPRRLWKRYLIGNTKFIYFLMVDAVRSFGKN